VLGGFYFSERATDGSFAATFQGLASVRPPFFQPAYTLFDGRASNSSKGVYGQGTYHLTDRLSFTGGLRYSVETKGVVLNNKTVVAGREFCLVPSCPYSTSKDFSGVSYTADLDYKITDDAMVYARASRGFRSGGQNIRGAFFAPASLLPFRPEIATSEEVGLKSELFDRMLRLNLAGYYTNVDDVQRSTTAVVGTQTATFIGNAATMRIYGFEAEANAVLPAGFRLDTTLAYTNAKYVKFVDPVTGFDRSREPVILTPEWTASISPSWSHELNFGRLGLRADFAYQSATAVYPTGFYRDSSGVSHDATTGVPVSAADAAGFTAAATDKAHWLINGRANLTVADGKYDFAIWVRNLGNIRDNVSGLPIRGLGSADVIRREPRTYGATVTAKF